MWQVLELVDFAEKGNLPVAGGVLDQTECFNQVLRLARSEENQVKAEAAARRQQPPPL